MAFGSPRRLALGQFHSADKDGESVLRNGDVGSRIKNHCWAQSSSLALSPRMGFYPLVSISRKDFGSTLMPLNLRFE